MFEPLWCWIPGLALALARTWGTVSGRLGRVGAVTAVPAVVLMFLPALVASRVTGNLAAISPHAALTTSPQRPASARRRYLLLWGLCVFGVLLAPGLLVAAVMALLLVLAPGAGYVVAGICLLEAVLALVDYTGMIQGGLQGPKMRRLSGVLMDSGSVAEIGNLGAWPRGSGHGSRLLEACHAELAASRRWDAVLIAPRTPELESVYGRYGFEVLDGARGFMIASSSATP